MSGTDLSKVVAVIRPSTSLPLVSLHTNTTTFHSAGCLPASGLKEWLAPAGPPALLTEQPRFWTQQRVDVM
jgi:hypothetical protein